MKNLQVPEARWLHEKGFLEVHEVFKTIQGEGPFAGLRAIFVRLAGCNLQCPLCDTAYSGGTKCTPSALVDRVEEHQAGQKDIKLIVLTGGEPFRQNIVPFVLEALMRGFQVQVETNGSLWLPAIQTEISSSFPFSIVCSPKHKIHEQLAKSPFLKALKYVVKAGACSPVDGLPDRVLGLKGMPPARIEHWVSQRKQDIFIQPADEQVDFRNALNMQEAVSSCMKFGYRLAVQMHKYAELA